MIIYGYFSTIFFIIYFLLCFILILAWFRTPTFQPVRTYPIIHISVIIPVRNEAKNIISLLEDLNQQNYPFSSFEVFVMNDNSEDETRTLVESFQKESHYILHLKDITQSGKIASPKKQAITQAVGLAKGELIICTDGDCRVSSEWLTLICQYYQAKNAKFISAPVTFLDNSHIFTKMQIVEFASLIGTGASSLFLGFPNMCNGANLAYPKKVFYEVKGYEGVENLASGDDEFLMHKIAKKYPKQIYFLKHQQAIVNTTAQEKLSGFIHQRRRWASKWSYYKSMSPKVLASFIFLIHLLLILTAISSFIGNLDKDFFLVQILLKISIEFVFLSALLNFLKKKRLIPYIFLVQLIYPFYILYFGIFSRKKEFVWKGRNMK